MSGSELDDGTSDELRVIPHRHVANPREHVNLGGGTAVVDSRSFGKMYVSPINLARFEQDAGSTNKSTVRMEGNAVFGTERTTAACRINP